MKKIFIFLIFFLNSNFLYAESKFAYINVNHILNNSIVGKSISEHINNIRKNKINEFNTIEKDLANKEQNLIKKKNIIDKDEFDKEVILLKNEILIYENKKKKFNDEMDQKKMKYTKTILDALNPIVSSYVEKNSILIVFEKKNIIIAKKDLDITIPIMNILNTKLNNIDFWHEI